MNIITQEAKKRQAVVKTANKKKQKLCKPKIWCQPVECKAVVQTL